MKFSLVALAVAMTVSVHITAQYGTHFASITIAIMLALFLLYSLIIRKVNAGVVIVLLLCGVSAVSYTHTVNSHKSIEFINRYVTVEGTIISPAEKSDTSDSYRYVFRAKSIRNSIKNVKTNEDIVLTTPKQYNCGTSLRLDGIMDSLPKQMNESGFNATAYYQSKNIFARIHCKTPTQIEKIRVFTPYIIGGYITENIDRVIYKYYEGDGAAILSTVIAGTKHHYSSEYDELLAVTGFKRVLHPAYIHIGIIMTLLLLIRGFVHRKYRNIIALVIFLAYALIQCANVGFSRCMLCVAIAIILRRIRGSSYFPDTLAIILIISAVAMPTMLFNVSLMLSLTAGLIAWCFVSPVSRRLTFLPLKAQRPCAVMIVFCLLLTPITAYFYSGFCIYSYFVPIITIPVVGILVIISPIAFGMYELFGTAPIFGAYVNMCVNILYRLPCLIERLPFSYINLGKPSLTFIAMFVCVLFMLYYRMKGKPERSRLYIPLVCGFAVAMVVSSVSKMSMAQFMFVNVGQGDGSVIHTPFRETVVIDAGGSSEWSDYNAGSALFVPYLDAEGINHIETVIVSHYHRDHAEGILSVLKRYRVDGVFIPPITDADSDAMQTMAQEICDIAKENKTRVYVVENDTRLEFKDGLTIDIFAPSEWVRRSDENNTSLCVKASYGDFSALYTGDMSSDAESAIIARANADADVLKVAHHGSSKSSGSEFIDAVSPDIAVISCGEDNTYGHPNTEVLDRLSGVRILRTDQMGDIRISAQKSGEYNVKTMK